MDGASDVPSGMDGANDMNQPPMGDDMSAAPGGDQSIDAGMPGGEAQGGMQQDDTLGGEGMDNDLGDDMGDDMGNDMGNDMGDDMSNGPEDDDSTMSIINQLSDTDREAVRAYAESMLSRSESQGDMGPEGDEAADMPDNNNGGPMMETFMFKKGQLLQLNEKLGTKNKQEKDVDNKPLAKKNTSKTVSSKSPFAPKRFK